MARWVVEDAMIVIGREVGIVSNFHATSALSMGKALTSCAEFQV